ELAADELFALAVELGGSISGEHGIGRVEAGQLGKAWPEPLLSLATPLKLANPMKNFSNSGKMLTPISRF
ncbi:MAG: FAD-linked oxidase C-terminal domain-containing protein, partial [Acidobacteriota bacterium]